MRVCAITVVIWAALTGNTYVLPPQCAVVKRLPMIEVVRVCVREGARLGR